MAAVQAVGITIHRYSSSLQYNQAAMHFIDIVIYNNNDNNSTDDINNNNSNSNNNNNNDNDNNSDIMMNNLKSIRYIELHTPLK